MTSLPGDDDVVTHGVSVDPARIAKVRAAFEAALEQPAAARAVFAANACAGDPVLLREVQAMLVADAEADALLDPPSPTPASTPEEGRFPAGTVLAGRYRILTRLGQGGMGEVYRAHDLILNQTVALKFLNPGHLSEAALARFRNEVRIARQVSHPHVCRVYDLGMVEGLHFLSMEYIDGEDLASLLRRIGRLPQDKAIEFTRKICAGLGAAHERGVLHRDLKPANIMIDGRGQPRITDFGLAGLAAEIPLSDLRSGTPAYMSPEQKAGKDVTTRSDLYALGLVLHEMFTGKRRADTQSHPTDLVKDLDPTLERLILRCLEEDPKRRPASAFNVAMALPGADPIAAALAAGETPSPEMVAASHEKEGFSTRTAWLCFALVLILTAILPLVAGPLDLASKIPLNLKPDVLADRARQMLGKLGYAEKPVDSEWGFIGLPDFDLRALPLDKDKRDAILASNRPAVMGFWYRQAKAPLVARMIDVDTEVPPNSEPGMMLIVLDTEANLLRLDIRPPEREKAVLPPTAPDWNALIRLAGLDPARFHQVDPTLTPPMAFDVRTAWEGTLSDDRNEKVRVEAAAWRGQVVFFRGPNDWLPRTPPALLFGERLLAVLSLGILLGGLLTAARNWRSGRGDRTGAIQLATWMAAGVLLTRLAQHHLPSFQNESAQVTDAFMVSFFGGVIVGAFYMALEPLVRRNWPDSLISWNRLQSHRFKDPLVASHILAGLAILTVGLIANALTDAVSPTLVMNQALTRGLGRSTFFLYQIGSAIFYSVLATLAFLLIVVFLRLILLPIARGRLWVADLLATTPFAAPLFFAQPFDAVLLVVMFGLLVFAVRRFGLLTAMTMAIFYHLVQSVPLVLSSWWAPQVWLTLAMLVALAAWALWVILTDKGHAYALASD